MTDQEHAEKMSDWADLLDDAELATMLREMADDDVIYPAEVIITVDGFTSEEDQPEGRPPGAELGAEEPLVQSVKGASGLPAC